MGGSQARSRIRTTFLIGRLMLKWLDRLNPTIAELYQALEQQVENGPEAQRLTTHPGMGPLTALAFVLILGTTDRFHCGKLIASFVGLVPLERSSGNRRRLGQITKKSGVRCCVSCWWKRLRSIREKAMVCTRTPRT
jgi:transposase